MENPSYEAVLAQEQGVTMQEGATEKESGAGLRGREIEGTLVLTNKRLIFVCSDEQREDVPMPTGLNPFGNIRVFYSEVEDVDRIPKNPPNLFISIASVSSARGHRTGMGGRPRLDVEWSDERGRRAVVFTQMLTGSEDGKKRNLNDWAAIIEKLKAGEQRLLVVPQSPSPDSLEGKIARVLGDMQEKGLFSIEEEVENEFKVELDPDEVQAACDALSSRGILIRRPDSSGDFFYRRVSPLDAEAT